MTVTERKFDRIPSRPHPRMAEFRAASILPTTSPRSYTWGCEAWLNQGEEGACVPHGFAHEAWARPMVHPVPHLLVWEWYEWCRRNDEWHGEDYDGTSVDAGARCAREYGTLGSWYWAKGIGETIMALGRKGPVVFGLDWFSGMFDTNDAGYIRPLGEWVGGHCLLGRGVRLMWKPGTTAAQRASTDWLAHLDLTRTTIRLRNSWGQHWGMNGDALITAHDLSALLDRQGEVVVPLQRLAP